MNNQTRFQRLLSAAVLVAVCVVTAASCATRDDIKDLQKQIDSISDTQIKSLDQQISSIKTSLTDLEKTDKALKTYIDDLTKTAEGLQSSIDKTDSKIDAVKKEFDTAIADAKAEAAADNTKLKNELVSSLESAKADILAQLSSAKADLQGQIDRINETIATLQKKDTELEAKIAELRSYVDGQLKDTKDWASATFATLEQYNSTVTTVTAIQQTIENLNTSMSEIDTKISDKVSEEIKSSLGDISDQIDEVTEAVVADYTSAIATAKSETEAAYTQAISEAISALETSLKSWVNKQFTNYYTIAQIDAKLSSLKSDYTSKLSSQKAYLESMIESLDNSLQTKITENTKLIESLNTQVSQNTDAIASNASAISTNAESISTNANTISANSTAISKNSASITKLEKSIASLTSDMESKDAELQKLIAQNTALIAANKSGIEDNSSKIAANEASIAKLEQEIAGIKSDMSDLETSLKKLISDNTELIKSNKGQIESNSSLIAANKSAIANLKSSTEASIDANAKAIASNASSIEANAEAIANNAALISTNATAIANNADAISQNASDIAQLRTDLQTTRSEITAEYKSAIASAIETSEGKLTAELNSQISTVNSRIDSEIAAVNASITALETRVTTCEKDITGIKSQMEEIQKAIDDLKSQISGSISNIISVSYVPKYSDHKARMNYTDNGTVTPGTATLDFEVRPVSAAAELVKIWESALSVSAVYTVTKSAPEMVSLAIESVTEENGFITLTVSGTGLKDDFFRGSCSASARLKISDGSNEIVTEYIQMVPAKSGSESGTGSDLTITVSEGVNLDMVYVEGGTFSMGSTDSDAESDESPVHNVTLSSYYIGKYEVTQELWKAVMGSNPSSFSGTNLPVETISWNDCQNFITKLNEMTGKTFRLPTEAEWEYAARGGQKSKGYKYSGSDTIDDVAWYDGNSENKTHAVGTKAPNELGIYDMSGNVWEWCQDWYGSYTSDAQTDPTGAASGSNRVYRGGSWYSLARRCRCAYRNYYDPDYRIDYYGLRLVLSE